MLLKHWVLNYRLEYAISDTQGINAFHAGYTTSSHANEKETVYIEDQQSLNTNPAAHNRE